MKLFAAGFSIFLFIWAPPSYGRDLSCSQVHRIQKKFLKHHILDIRLTPKLRDKVIDQFLKSLDREKIYFLRSDMSSIKRRNSRLFSDLKRNRCQGLFYIYNIYAKRIKERMNFAEKILNDDFRFIRKLKYVLDDDLKSFPNSTHSANQKMKAYLQYQVANVFLFEKDLKKSVEQVSVILNNFKKQVMSWKPQLNPKELRSCLQKSKNSFKACKPSKWLSNYLNAYSQSLDSHSSYLDSESLEEFYISMNLELEGIGATLSSRFGYTVVEKLIPGGAADKSKKLKVKDKILAVGQNRKNMIDIFGERIEDVVSIIRGPKGTPVYLQISRENEKKQKRVFVIKLIRDKVDLKEEAASISYHDIMSGGKNYKIGLLKAPSFYGSSSYGKSVTRDVKKLLIQASKKKISALVLDLSNNRGGSLDEAVNLSGLFFSEGNVVKQSEKNNSRPQILRDRDKRIFYTGPLIVLVNRLSASASEIVSGTLQDYQRAIVVGGDHTFGKGSVQSVEPLFSRLGALKTTVGLYFIPSGKSTQKTGVNSDISFPSIFNIDELGEKSLDHSLPPETIANFKSSPEEIFSSDKERSWKPVNQSLIRNLKKKSKARISKSKDFQDIIARLKKIKEKAKNKKAITIGEVLEEKNKKDEEEEAAEEAFSQTEKDKKKYFARPDIQEALNIAGDLAHIYNQKEEKNQSARPPQKSFSSSFYTIPRRGEQPLNDKSF